MKSITIFLILFIIKSSISERGIEDISTNLFINRLKNEGLFDTIFLIKNLFGQDFSILVCEQLNKNGYGNCKKVVKEYMPTFKTRSENSSHSFDSQKTTILEKILSQKFTKKQAKMYADRIIKRAEEIGISIKN